MQMAEQHVEQHVVCSRGEHPAAWLPIPTSPWVPDQEAGVASGSHCVWALVALWDLVHSLKTPAGGWGLGWAPPVSYLPLVQAVGGFNRRYRLWA